MKLKTSRPGPLTWSCTWDNKATSATVGLAGYQGSLQRCSGSSCSLSHPSGTGTHMHMQGQSFQPGTAQEPNTPVLAEAGAQPPKQPLSHRALEWKHTGSPRCAGGKPSHRAMQDHT